MSCTFATFAEQVREKNLTPRDCGNNHWRILGGADGVNFYPSTKRGARMHVDGAKSGSRHGVTVADAIAAANAPPTVKTKTRHCRTRDRERSPEQDVRSNETRKGNAMKAEEFGCFVRSLARTTNDIRMVIGPGDDVGLAERLRASIRTLGRIWEHLDQHRLEMEAGEADKAPDIPGIVLESRLERIDERLGEIEETVSNLDQVTVRRLDRHHRRIVETRRRLEEIE